MNMFNYDTYVMRHGEGFILQLVEGAERYKGIPSQEWLSLEDRWNIVINDNGVIMDQMTTYAA